ncbi:FAD-binding domain-containing protein [Haloferula sp. A504]|uniref:FAD-binding domain-containing protein n=1 Tax=Haloferula sp. A504 TaxID=3373601 RepID=UPI0031C9DAF6|nr:hypothetical protein [Verrucomicrobiaceae bacterium E54]
MNRPEPTREAALRRLTAFVPDAGKYAGRRNFDFGPDDRSNVSTLSPYLRTRLVTEKEVCLAVLERFARSTVDKFLQEVAWRTYWKGWLEMRPEVWSRYRLDLEQREHSPEHERAIRGETGIECFDFWVRELIETGYLHNHARMWFAGIWIFTLRLPWQMGADFFLRHLLDGDPASNTLSWRWVAGLHTTGKHYLARASNIKRFTGGRFDPAGQLDESAPALPPDGEFERRDLDFPENPRPGARLGQLLIPDDLTPIGMPQVESTAGWFPEDSRVLGDPSEKVVDFHRGALDDALSRTGGPRLRGRLSESVRDWATREKLDAIIMTRPTVGPWRDLFAGFDPGVPVHHFVSDWDRQLWPHATAGFFRLKKRLPKFFDALVSGQRSLF